MYFCIMIITSRNNPFIKRVVSLREKKFRREYGEYIIEGVKQVREAAQAGCDFVNVVVAESYAGEHFYPDKEQVVSDGVFAKLSEEPAPQGILAVLKLPDCPVEVPAKDAILLDGVADPGNLGTIIRSANAAGYSDIYLRDCADVFSPKCLRAAMSGVFFVRIHIGPDAEIFDALARIPKICADMKGDNVFTFHAPEKFCLVIGNEANGVSKSVRSICDFTVKIPMRESCESLNAGISAAVLMYELRSDYYRLIELN